MLLAPTLKPRGTVNIYTGWCLDASIAQLMSIGHLPHRMSPGHPDNRGRLPLAHGWREKAQMPKRQYAPVPALRNFLRAIFITYPWRGGSTVERHGTCRRAMLAKYPVPMLLWSCRMVTSLLFTARLLQRPAESLVRNQRGPGVGGSVPENVRGQVTERAEAGSLEEEPRALLLDNQLVCGQRKHLRQATWNCAVPH